MAIYKPDFPIRPILAAYKTPAYKIAKFLAKLLRF